jgi:tRNA uridine 5-carbamoylmethylation protein Kti12
MIIVLNGYPGVGKLTIGTALTSLLNARMLDIHTVYNLAFALSDFGTPTFWDTIEQVENIAYDLIEKLPLDQPIIFTTVLTDKSVREREEWAKLVKLGQTRPPFCVVHIGCDLDENIRRIQSPERSQKRKPRIAEMAKRNQSEAEPLAGLSEQHLLQIDTTNLSADQAAIKIQTWLSKTIS